MNGRLAFASILFSFILAGCGRVDLYSNLSEQQANEVTAVLIGAEINADKSLTDAKAWRIKIDKADFPRAMDVLEQAGLPREKFMSMSEAFKKEGFISSPLEERARFIAATAQELERTISLMVGVLEARVHLAMPERDPLTDKIVPSSASVFVKYSKDTKLGDTGGVANIKAIVRDAVEGLAADRITVVALPGREPWRQLIRPSPEMTAAYAYQKPFVSPTQWLILAILGTVVALCVAWFTRDRWLKSLRAVRGAINRAT
jgi:type III secretion protein J